MKFNKPCVNFWRVWTKNTKCWGILRKCSKIFKKFLQKFLKTLYFSIFFKRFNKPMRSFFAVWTKNTNCCEILRKFWKFLMKIQLKNWILLWYLENLLLKIEPSEITQFFYNNFFGFGGGGNSLPSPPKSAYGNHNFTFRKVKISQLKEAGELMRTLKETRDFKLHPRIWKILLIFDDILPLTTIFRRVFECFC